MSASSVRLHFCMGPCVTPALAEFNGKEIHWLQSLKSQTSYIFLSREPLPFGQTEKKEKEKRSYPTYYCSETSVWMKGMCFDTGFPYQKLHHVRKSYDKRGSMDTIQDKDNFTDVSLWRTLFCLGPQRYHQIDLKILTNISNVHWGPTMLQDCSRT